MARTKKIYTPAEIAKIAFLTKQSHPSDNLFKRATETVNYFLGDAGFVKFERGYKKFNLYNSHTLSVTGEERREVIMLHVVDIANRAVDTRFITIKDMWKIFGDHKMRENDGMFELTPAEMLNNLLTIGFKA